MGGVGWGVESGDLPTAQIPLAKKRSSVEVSEFNA